MPDELGDIDDYCSALILLGCLRSRYLMIGLILGAVDLLLLCSAIAISLILDCDLHQWYWCEYLLTLFDSTSD